MTINSSTHKKILLKILFDIYSDKTIGPFLGFKGGTAAYIFYGLNRFSVDLDFDLLDKVKEKYIFEKIGKIIKKYGAVKEARIKKFNIIFILSYYQKEENAQNIKIEINRRDFGSNYELKSYMGISMIVMTKDDMFANKLIAMLERLGKTNRDIYDIWFFAKTDWPINKKFIQKRTGMPYKNFLQKCISSLEIFNDKNVLDGLGELSSTKQKTWAKNKLKNEVLFLLKLIRDSER